MGPVPQPTVGEPTDRVRVCLAVPPTASTTLLGAAIGWSRPQSDRAEPLICRTLSLESCGHLKSVRVLTRANCLGSAPWVLPAFTVIPRCSLPDLVHLWCAHASSPIRRHLPLLRPVALHQHSDPCVVCLAVQLRHKIVRTQLVQISPPSMPSVVPDPVSTWYTPGYVASPAHSPSVSGIVPACFRMHSLARSPRD